MNAKLARAAVIIATKLLPQVRVKIGSDPLRL